MNNTIKVFDQNAQVYLDKFINETKYHVSYNVFCKHLKPNAQVLELACGPGIITQYVANKRPDIQILATDLSEKMLELAQSNSPKSKFRKLDARDITSLQQSFDGIICGFGFPYFTKEEVQEFIVDSGNTLTNQGVLYISTMEDDYKNSGWRKSKDGRHELFIHYHEAEYLSASLKGNGLEVIHEERHDIPDEAAKDLLIVAKKI